MSVRTKPFLRQVILLIFVIFDSLLSLFQCDVFREELRGSHSVPSPYLHSLSCFPCCVPKHRHLLLGSVDGPSARAQRHIKDVCSMSIRPRLSFGTPGCRSTSLISSGSRTKNHSHYYRSLLDAVLWNLCSSSQRD